MRFVFILFLIAAVFAKAPITDLDVDTYRPYIESHTDVVVKYYTPWCHHCKRLEPIYEAVAEALTKRYPQVVFAQVDVNDNPRIGRLEKLSGVPIIRYFKNGKPLPYEGRMDKQFIQSFIENIITSSFEGVHDSIVDTKLSELRANLQKYPQTIVAYCDDKSRDYIAVLELAMQEVVNLTRIVISEPDVASKMSVPFPSLVLYHSTDKGIVYHGALDKNEVLKWILVADLPPIVPYTVSFTRRLFDKRHGINLQLFFFAPEKNPGSKAQRYRAILEPIAEKYRGTLFISHIPSENPRLLDYYGVRATQVPTIGLANFVGARMDKYAFSGEFTEENIVRFIERFLKGELKPFLRSEDEPKTNEGPVYTIVGSTFSKMVYDPSMDVVVKFYASWDGKSSDLAPEFLAAAKHFVKDSSVLFGEVDVMKNEMEGIDTKEFPKVILFKAGGNGRESVEFKGEMEADKIVAFVEANRGSKLGDSEELWSVCLILVFQDDRM